MNILNTSAGLCLGTILFFFSCSEPSSVRPVGLESSNAALIDTFALPVEVFLKDTIRSENNTELMCGMLQHDDFGVAYARAFTGVSRAQNFNADPSNIYDSIATVLTPKYIYGSRTAQQTLNVYQLNERIATGTPYTTTSPAPALGALLGTRTYAPNDFVSKPVRVTLPNTLGTQFFNELQTGNGWSGNDEAFRNAFNGIALIPDSAPSPVLSFDATSYIALYYHRPGETQPRIANFYFNTESRFTKVSSDRSGTPLQNIAIETNTLSTELGNRGFMQAGTGVRTAIDLSQLKDLFVSDEYIYTINLAQLELFNLADDDSLRPVPGAFVVQEAMSTGRPVLNANVPVLLTQAGYFKGSYLITLTEYVSDIVNGRSATSKILLNISTSVDDIRVSNVAFGDARHPSKPMKFKVYYTRKRK